MLCLRCSEVPETQKFVPQSPPRYKNLGYLTCNKSDGVVGLKHTESGGGWGVCVVLDGVSWDVVVMVVKVKVDCRFNSDMLMFDAVGG